MNAQQKDTVLKIMNNLQTAHDLMEEMPENYKRDAAYDLIEKAHEAVAALLVCR